jgi:hypothetical protein
MYSKNYKLKCLHTFFMNVPYKSMSTKCPFGKHWEEPFNKSIFDKIACEELCGLWPELGDVRRGCPCHMLGSLEAMRQLERILTKAGRLKDV